MLPIKLSQLDLERPISIEDACKYLGRLTGKRPHLSTVWRWCLKGCHGVKLESVCIGGRRYVTVPAIERFVNRSSFPAVPVLSAAPKQSRRDAAYQAMRKAQVEEARNKLDEILAPKRSRPSPR